MITVPSMHIGFVVPGGFDRSGRERVIPSLLWLVERLTRQHRVDVYVLQYHDRACSYPLLGAMVHDLGRPRGLLRQYAAVTRALKRHGPFDVLHGYLGVPSGLVAALAGRRLGIPSVVTLMSGEFVALPDIEYGQQLHWRQRRAIAATLGLATALTVPTEFMQKLARAQNADAHLIQVGVDTTQFSPAGEKADGPPWRLLHVASLNRVKDQATLVDAIASVVARIPSVHLDIVGEDTLDGSIQQRARKLNLDRHVSFHGFVSGDELVRFYRAAHLHVLSSRHEAAGIVCLEAAACGVPTVGTAVGQIADWMPDCATGVTPGDSTALAEAIRSLLADGGRRTRIGERAREYALKHDADWTASRFEELYRRLSS